jgi:GLPGLI family protein
MKKYPIFLIVILILCCIDINAQKSDYKVTYKCQTNIEKGKNHDGKNSLYFNKEKSVFIHDDWPKEDSYIDGGFVMGFTKGDKEGMPVYIDLKSKEMIYKTDYNSNPTTGCIILIEPLPTFSWNIIKETKKIGAYDCIKAVGDFGNRTYHVWFTPSIPIALGPYKLGGLPGLILEAKSTDNRVSYEFISLEKTTDNAETIEKPKEGKLMNWSQFEELIINFLLRVEATSTATAKGTNNDPPAEFEIEKSKFTINSEYKRKRNLKKY